MKYENLKNEEYSEIINTIMNGKEMTSEEIRRRLNYIWWRIEYIHRLFVRYGIRKKRNENDRRKWIYYKGLENARIDKVTKSLKRYKYGKFEIRKNRNLLTGISLEDMPHQTERIEIERHKLWTKIKIITEKIQWEKTVWKNEGRIVIFKYDEKINDDWIGIEYRDKIRVYDIDDFVFVLIY